MKRYRKVDYNFDLQDLPLKEKNSRNKTKNNKRDFLSILSLNIGIYLLTPLLLGVFIGYIIDNHFRKKPLFTIIFIIFGAASSFYNLLRLTKDR